MESTQTGSRALIKLLAIIGFFAILGCIVWLIVQGVRMFPSAFMSLASIAETVGGYRPQSELSIDLEKNIVNSGETFTITWTDMGKGSYTFTHVCREGVILFVRTSEGMLREVPCTDSLSLPHDVHGLFLSIQAREQRFSDVDFAVSFDAEKGDTHVTDGRVTVVNATVPTKTEAAVVLGTDVPTKIDTPSVGGTIPLPPTSETPVVPSTPVTPRPSFSTPSQPAASVVSILPKSYEDGFTDLRAMYLGVGTIENGTFVPKATFNEDDTAAFRFEVKNIGTKTSDSWTYELSLPGGVSYASDTQSPLTPNERAIFTIGFELNDAITSASVKIGGEVKTKDDSDAENNDFDWSVKVTN